MAKDANRYNYNEDLKICLFLWAISERSEQPIPVLIHGELH